MRVRFISNVVLALAAGFVVVASQAFGSAVTGWIAFGVALGIVLLLGASQLDRRRGVTQRSLDGIAAVVAAWTVVAAVVFSGSVVTWLAFAGGLGLVAVALAGLIVHELSTERVVHTLEFDRSSSDSQQHYAAA